MTREEFIEQALQSMDGHYEMLCVKVAIKPYLEQAWDAAEEKMLSREEELKLFLQSAKADRDHWRKQYLVTVEHQQKVLRPNIKLLQERRDELKLEVERLQELVVKVADLGAHYEEFTPIARDVEDCREAVDGR